MLSHYYYARLSDAGKTVYNEIVCGLMERKRAIRVSFPPSEDVFRAVRLENPLLYYADLASWREVISGDVRKILPTYIYDEKQCEEIMRKFDRLYETFQNFEGELFIRKVHNWFTRYVSYDEEEKRGKLAAENHCLVGPVMCHKGVCEGISFAYDFLLKRKGFDCTVATGICNGEGHMWNVVCLNGHNYHIDVTNDIVQTNSCFDKPCYFYYLITNEAMSKTATFEEQFHCVQTADNPFYVSGKVFNDDGLKHYLAGVSHDIRTVFFKYVGKKAENELTKLVAAYLLPKGNGRIVSAVDNTCSVYYFAVQGG